ncbi:hypothetical protein FRC07_004274 [Ceratobasidium sp. 392]|nr:hypothetical protein FRC07_004274 [Ceratobasidium sp. 392]
MAESQTLHCNDDDEFIFDEADLVVPETLPGSKEDTIFNCVKKGLFKIARLAHKLRYLPAAKAAFKAVCVKLEMILPHNIWRDMKIRCNSTGFMLEDAYRLCKAILNFQSTAQFMPDTQLLSAEDKAAIEHLLLILKTRIAPSPMVSIALSANLRPRCNSYLKAINTQYASLTKQYSSYHYTPATAPAKSHPGSSYPTARP